MTIPLDGPLAQNMRAKQTRQRHPSLFSHSQKNKHGLQMPWSVAGVGSESPVSVLPSYSL